MTRLLTHPTVPDRPARRAVDGRPPEVQRPPERDRRGFTDCRGEWHSLDEED